MKYRVNTPIKILIRLPQGTMGVQGSRGHLGGVSKEPNGIWHFGYQFYSDLFFIIASKLAHQITF